MLMSLPVGNEQNLGDRVRAMRIEQNLSLEGLAAALQKQGVKHHFSWFSKVELNQINLSLSDLYALSGTLKVTPGWLVSGDLIETEFVTRLRGMEPLMDDRGRREVMATAQRQVDENTVRARAIERLLSDPELEARYQELLAELSETDRAAGAPEPEAPDRPRRQVNQG
jgi:transcriptional regulator with XRE-family HTH domain